MLYKLPSDEIHVWTYLDVQPINGDLARFYYQILSKEEKEKYQQYAIEAPKRQYLVTRGMLRTLLSRYWPEVIPQAWKIHVDRHGKPFLANDLSDSIQFSLSHTQGMIVIAMGLEAMLGVDIENICRKTKIMDIAKGFFSTKEVNQLEQQPTSDMQRDYFFKIWTLKEAFIKATGKGISVGLDQFSIILKEDNQHQIEFINAKLAENKVWQLWQQAPTAMHHLALAIGKVNHANYQIVQNNFVPNEVIKV